MYFFLDIKAYSVGASGSNSALTAADVEAEPSAPEADAED